MKDVFAIYKENNASSAFCRDAADDAALLLLSVRLITIKQTWAQMGHGVVISKTQIYQQLRERKQGCPSFVPIFERHK